VQLIPDASTSKRELPYRKEHKDRKEGWLRRNDVFFEGNCSQDRLGGSGKCIRLRVAAKGGDEGCYARSLHFLGHLISHFTATLARLPLPDLLTRLRSDEPTHRACLGGAEQLPLWLTSGFRFGPWAGPIA